MEDKSRPLDQSFLRMQLSSQPIPKPWKSTPLIRSAALSIEAGCNVYLKLENLQPSGSFKSRCIGNFIRSTVSNHGPKVQPSLHFYTSCNCNVDLGCIHAAVHLGYPVTVITPTTMPEFVLRKYRQAGVEEVIVHGTSVAEAHEYAIETVVPQARAQGQKAVHVPGHGFDDEVLWTGTATLSQEILAQLAECKRAEGTEDEKPVKVDGVVCSVGGGGLLAGIVQGLDEVCSTKTHVLAVEPVGADALARSLAKGELVTLPMVTSIVSSLGSRTVARRAFELAQRETVHSSC